MKKKKVKTERDYYNEIDKALKSYEEGKSWHDKPIEWICNRIDWCHHWKKITEEETELFVDRVVEVMQHTDF